MITETPTTEHLAQVMIHATAPAFILGALASFIALIIGRMNGIIERSRMIGAIRETDAARLHLKEDLPRLRRRSYLLHRAIHLSVASAIVTTLLICLAFATAFFGWRHEIGGGLLFVVALLLFGGALVYLAREVSIGLTDFDHMG
ncbi:MAG: hypothetical protein K0R27_4668 [Xanthobacteraceae bacterium]|jgi:hypothetical protein|nr:hypothetical protein [Xanthobacteraceae bacterium]